MYIDRGGRVRLYKAAKFLVRKQTLVYELNALELSSELDSNNEKCYALHYVPNVFVLIDKLDLFHGSARFRLDSLGWSSKHTVHGLFGIF